MVVFPRDTTLDHGRLRTALHRLRCEFHRICNLGPWSFTGRLYIGYDANTIVYNIGPLLQCIVSSYTIVYDPIRIVYDRIRSDSHRIRCCKRAWSVLDRFALSGLERCCKQLRHDHVDDPGPIKDHSRVADWGIVSSLAVSLSNVCSRMFSTDSGCKQKQSHNNFTV